MVLPHRLCFQIQRWPGRKIKQLSGSSIHAYLCNWTHVKKHIPVSQNLRICIIRFPRPVYRLESEADREFSFTSVTKALGTDNELITTIKSSKEIGDENILQMLKPIPPTHPHTHLPTFGSSANPT
jgi:hypothetical protein